MLAALCHDFGKVIATESIDGQLHAYSHEVLGLPMVSTFLGRLTRNKRLTAYVLNLVKLHMKPNIMAGERPKMKSTNRLFDSAVDPEGLILLARADYLGSPGREILEENEGFLGSRLLAYRQMMSRPWFKGEDLIQAGITPGPEVSQGLEYGHKLRLAGIDKENGLKQTLAYMRKGK
jgi:tRNA nucleotidyltransferase (CCA-adding enzyme)